MQLIFIIIISSVISFKTNNNHLRNYPEALIKNENYAKFYVLDIPYCNTNFCKVSIIDQNTINIRSFSNFRLNKYFKFHNVHLKNSILRNNFNGMNLFIPKNRTFIRDKADYKISNNKIETKDTELKNRDLNYISEGIFVEDLDNDVLDYPKDPKAKSGYYNNRDIWINY